MWILTHLNAVNIAILVAAVTVITVVYAVRVAGDDRRHEPATPVPICPYCDRLPCLDKSLCDCTAPCGSWRCPQPEIGDDVIVLGRPIPEHVRQAIAERETGND